MLSLFLNHCRCAPRISEALDVQPWGNDVMFSSRWSIYIINMYFVSVCHAILPPDHLFVCTFVYVAGAHCTHIAVHKIAHRIVHICARSQGTIIPSYLSKKKMNKNNPFCKRCEHHSTQHFKAHEVGNRSNVSVKPTQDIFQSSNHILTVILTTDFGPKLFLNKNFNNFQTIEKCKNKNNQKKYHSGFDLQFFFQNDTHNRMHCCWCVVACRFFSKSLIFGWSFAIKYACTFAKSGFRCLAN